MNHGRRTPATIRSGPLKGKRIILASQTGVQEHEALAAEFLKKIFGIESALITDESAITDFCDADRDVEHARAQVRKEYGIESVPDNLVEIFNLIRGRASA